MRIRAVLLLVMSLFIAVGCGGGSKLVGDWVTNVPEMGNADISFNADGSLKMTADFSPGGNTAKIVITGKWRQEGDKVHTTYEDVKFTGLPPEMQAAEQKMEEGAKKGVGMGVDNVAVVKFNGDDSFTATDSKGTPSTYKRKGK